MKRDEEPVEYLNRRLGAMERERASFDNHYMDLAKFISPRRSRFYTSDRNRGDKKSWNNIINSHGTWAKRVATAGLMSGAMSPAQPWFKLETPDPDMMEFEPVKLWLQKVEYIMQAVMHESNFYIQLAVAIGELLQFSTAAMTHVDDFNDVARFYTHTVGSYYLAQDSKLRINQIARKFEWTVEQIVEEFGLDNVSVPVRQSYDRGDYNLWFPVYHLIEPNKQYRDGNPVSWYKKFRSVYWEPGVEDRKKLLSEKGFDYFPAYCPRWDVTGEDIYGTDGPAMSALGDISGLQIEEKRKAQGLDKMVDPVLAGPPALKNVPITGLPGGVNVYDSEGTNQLRQLTQINIPFQEIRADIKEVERRIDNAFYVDVWLAITNIDGIQPRNEFDLLKRDQERLLQLGPALIRIHRELASPFVDNLFTQCLKAGIFPDPPPELSGLPLRIQYISPLAQALRQITANPIQQLAGFVGGLVSMGYQSVTDKFDADQAVDIVGHAIGADPRVIVSDERVAEARAQRQQMMQAERALEFGQQGADVAKTMADAKVGEDGRSVLTELTKASDAAQ